MPPPEAGSGPAAVLVGAPGAGKSTVGMALAQRLGVAFRDTDADVEATLGMSVSDVFLEHGEEYFRAAERTAVLVALGEHAGVLALGGGAVLDAEVRAALARHWVVYLDVSASDAARRVGLARDRPLLVEGPRTRLAALLKARRPLYEEVAAITVDTGALGVEDVVAEILVERAGRASR
ncbi:shikimate kinase [Parafrankia colletiae]|uniref:Shikimate kinase n=1 Tax=Parafrankia colletiae TaxID=573497 RepID=A0A1S1R2S1_9ACTN|nr:shikimate kinase [Parafrankia colletiae]MCK9903493.1 shikimate kinase [Frankia sp. Cpl3]OHV41238.1 shikimate kinase [Parafrankia colletiae]